MGRRVEDLSGNVYGRLTVVEKSPILGKVKWVCKCECGGITTVIPSSLKSGNTKSCGCLHRESRTTHGMNNTPTYRSWCSMKSRCSNPKTTYYNRYGGRGISVCREWSSFEVFYKDMGERPIGMTLDRKDSEGNYDKGNCKWSTLDEQNNNKCGSVYLEYKGRLLTVPQWGRELGINKRTITTRLRRGWSVKEALSAEK